MPEEAEMGSNLDRYTGCQKCKALVKSNCGVNS